VRLLPECVHDTIYESFIVDLSPRANRQLDEIIIWLVENAGRDVAQVLIEDFEHLLDVLEEMPLLRPVHDTLPYRRSSIGRFDYTAWYQVDGNHHVTIIGFTHSRMGLPTVTARLRSP
jgi:plasmid stabilization system protein ParE